MSSILFLTMGNCFLFLEGIHAGQYISSYVISQDMVFRSLLSLTRGDIYRTWVEAFGNPIRYFPSPVLVTKVLWLGWWNLKEATHLHSFLGQTKKKKGILETELYVLIHLNTTHIPSGIQAFAFADVEILLFQFTEDSKRAWRIIQIILHKQLPMTSAGISKDKGLKETTSEN